MNFSYSETIAFTSSNPIVRNSILDFLEQYWLGDFRIVSSISSKRLDIFDFDYLLLDINEDFLKSEYDLLKQINKTNRMVYVFVDEQTENALKKIITLVDDKVMIVKKPEASKSKFVSEITETVEKIATSFKKNLNTDLSRVKMTHPEIVAIGASTGGPEAINTLIRSLPDKMPAILIVLHMQTNLLSAFCKRLQSLTKLKVVELRSISEIKENCIIVASGDHHMLINKKNGKVVAQFGDQIKENNHCPSVDSLFNSLSKIVDYRRVGIILTGMGIDGAYGLLNLKKSGALTIAQDRKSAAIYGMPKAAVELNAAQYVLSLEEIKDLLNSFSRSK